MTYKDLPDFLEALEKKGLMDTVHTEVDPYLEITEIADRVSKRHGPALKFTHVKGSKYPLVINTMGSFERLAMGLGVERLDEIAERIHDFMDLASYATLQGKLRAIPRLAPLPFIFPRKVKKAPCQDIVEEADLDTLPILHCWPQDGGRYITLPLVFTKDPESGQQNTGMYRLQVYDKKTTGMHWHLHKDGREIYEQYRRLGRKMPVAVAIGCDPAVIYAATAPLPKMIDEMLFAGFLRSKPVELVKCIASDLYVPAHAEFILEGYVDLDERREEGPFGDHTGYYSLQDSYPVFHVEMITRKKHPVYPTTIVGKPPMEDCYLGKATERIFLPLMRIQCPEMIDLDFPLEGVFHNCAIVSVKKAFPLHANKVLYALWGLGQMMYTKMIVVVDEDVDVHDYAKVLVALVENVSAPSHLVLTEGPLDALDHASERAFQGFRLGIDATRKMPSETKGLSPKMTFDKMDEFDITRMPFIRIMPFSKKDNGNALAFLESLALENDDMDDSSRDSVKHTLKDATISPGFANDEIENAPANATKGMQSNCVNTFPNTDDRLSWVVLVDCSINPEDLSTVAWKIFNNIDPKRDMVIRTRSDSSLFVGIDATKKDISDGLSRPWPDDIEMLPDIVQKVHERWLDYGIRLDW